MIVYREAGREDLPGILTLYGQLNPEDPELPLSEAEKIWNQSSLSGIIYFIAVDGSAVISACFINIIANLTRSGRPIGYIENVVTDSRHRRKGIGRTVLNMAIGYAAQKNCYKVVLQSSIKRKDAHAFYERIGFDGNSKKAFEIRFK
jgi:GNAT superfamily N-acetyltransferase